MSITGSEIIPDPIVHKGLGLKGYRIRLSGGGVFPFLYHPIKIYTITHTMNAVCTQYSKLVLQRITDIFTTNSSQLTPSTPTVVHRPAKAAPKRTPLVDSFPG